MVNDKGKLIHKCGLPYHLLSGCWRATLAEPGAEKQWEKVNGTSKKGYVNAFGAITAGQAMQQAKSGLEAVYLSGWQVAADGNTSETMYPDQSLYAYDSVPTMVRRINNTFKRADEIQWSRGIDPGDESFVDFSRPIVADAEAGFGGDLCSSVHSSSDTCFCHR